MRPSPPRNAFIGQDAGWCLRANRWGEWRGVRHFFAVVSRLGDGIFWYVLMAALIVVDGLEGLAASAHLAATGVIAGLGALGYELALTAIATLLPLSR